MPRAKLSSKGQVTVPRVVCERLGLLTGGEIDFDEERGIYTLRKHVSGAAFQRYRGLLTHLDGCDPDALFQDMRGPRSRWRRQRCIVGAGCIVRPS